ncbi:MAG TPA: CRISPR-associated endonuclease Cas2 [Blastocatellia bacterium]|nr:CRISPR-associated endonuclease Cas2 [Blastocatellia bacterium]HNG29921.1 CRISPR-associated endonuclease Cas2 [Blastocatellia bacterium]
MRIRYIVSYDISDPKRLRRVFRTMKGFGNPLQLSVFRCDLSASERVLLIEALSKVINHREDQVLLIDIGPVDGRGQDRIETIGRAMETAQLDRIAVIV